MVFSPYLLSAPSESQIKKARLNSDYGPRNGSVRQYAAHFGPKGPIFATM